LKLLEENLINFYPKEETDVEAAKTGERKDQFVKKAHQDIIFLVFLEFNSL